MAIRDIHPGLDVRRAILRSDVKARPWFDLKELDPALLLWLVLYGLGGGLLSMYYASIGYFPQIQWEESLIYLGAMTIAGAFLLLVFLLLLYVPGRIWCHFLICDRVLAEIFCYDPQRTKPCLKEVGKRIVVPFVLFVVAVHVLFSQTAGRDLTPEALGFLIVLLGVSFLLAATCLFFFLIRKAMLGLESWTSLPVDRRRHLFKLSGFFFLSGFSSFLAMWMIHWVDVPASRELVLLPIVCTTVGTFVNLFVAMTHHEGRDGARAALWAAIAGSFVLLILGDFLVQKQDAKLSARTMSLFGLGFHHSTELIVKKGGCEILKAHAILAVKQCGERTVIPEINILSRLGSEYFLHSSRHGKAFALPKEEVASWSQKL